MIMKYYIESDDAIRASYAMDILLDGIGLGGKIVQSPDDADIIYSKKAPETNERRYVWIQADIIEDWGEIPSRIGFLDDIPVYYNRIEPRNDYRMDSLRILGDIVYSTYVIAVGIIEKKEEKNVWGIIIGSNSSMERMGVLNTPVIARYSELLRRQLSMIRELHSIPRWPDGKQYAIVLTHDVDAPLSYRTSFPTITSALSKILNDAKHGKLLSCVRDSIVIGRSLTLRIVSSFLTPEEDANFRFDDWLKIEEGLGIKSCFYFATISCSDQYGSPADVEYRYDYPAIRRKIMKIHESNWEIGLHASINAGESQTRLEAEKEKLEDIVGECSIEGIRHHNWAMGSTTPEKTLWNQFAAGFKYDSSFGLNDSPGFRRGMIWPYFPFDHERQSIIPVLEIPPTLMDGGIFYQRNSRKDGVDKIRRHVSIVFKHRGAVVLDWHVEQLNPRRLNNAGSALVEVLRDLEKDANIFWASPNEMYHWWLKRKDMILEHSST